MEMFKSLAALKDAQQVVSQVDERFNLEVNGTIKVEKGDLVVELDYWCRVYTSGYTNNAICLDDWEVTSARYEIAGLKIDNYQDFTQGLKNNGLSSVADSLKISEREALVESLKTNTTIKKLYGKNIIIWDAMSQEWKKNFFIHKLENGDTISKYIAKSFDWIIDDEVMTLEQIKEFESNL